MIEQNLIRLVYLSEPQKSMTNDDIDNILRESRQNNELNNVTGILCFGGTDFIQVLEGEESLIIKLYAEILDDPRHKNCQLLDINFGQNRIFKRWAMGYVPQPRVDFDKLKSKLSNRNKTHQQTGSEVTLVLRAYLGKIL